MKFLDLNGKEYGLQIDTYTYGKKLNSKSNVQEKVGQELIKLFPNFTILEEVPIKTGNKTLYLDYFIPQLKIAVECNGEQHDKFTPFFHKTRDKFVKSQINDIQKNEWCITNNIKLITIIEKEIDNLKEKIWNK